MVSSSEATSNGHLLTAERKFRGVLRVASGILEFIGEEAQTTPTVRESTADILAIRRNVARLVFAIFLPDGRSHSFTLASPDADELTKVLVGMHPGVAVIDSTFQPQLSPLGGPVSLEIGAGLTVDAALTLEDRRLRCVPSLMGRLLGHRTYMLPMSQVALPRRLGHGSRVEFRVHGDTHVMIGVGAQHVWLGMRLLASAAIEAEEVQPMAIREGRGGVVATEALLGLTGSHVGAARAAAVGGEPLSFWCPIAAVKAIHTEGKETVVVFTDPGGAKALVRYPVRGNGADEWVSALRFRWWWVALPQSVSEDLQCTLAVLVGTQSSLFGHLELSTSGLVFYASGGEVVELALPGDEVLSTLNAEHVHSLRLNVAGAHRNLLVQDAAEMASQIAVVATTPSWILGRTDLGDVPLSAEEVSRCVGQAIYAHLYIDNKIAGAVEDRMVSPQVRDLHCDLMIVADLPPIPFLGELEVVNAKGRFVARVQVLRMGAQTSQATGVSRPVRFLLRIMSHVVDADRHATHRLKLGEVIDVQWVVAQKRVVVRGDVILMDLSVSGCGLVASEAPDDDTSCVLYAPRLIGPPDGPPIEVHGLVRYVRSAKDKKFRVGVVFVAPPSPKGKIVADSDPTQLGGMQLYQDREQKSLKDLADQAAAEAEMNKE